MHVQCSAGTKGSVDVQEEGRRRGEEDRGYAAPARAGGTYDTVHDTDALGFRPRTTSARRAAVRLGGAGHKHAPHATTMCPGESIGAVGINAGACTQRRG